MTPTTTTPWITAIKNSTAEELTKLIENRPIVAWFHKTELKIFQLIKVPSTALDSRWIIQGRMLYGSQTEDLTHIPETLDVCLNMLSAKDNWVLCEFVNEIAFFHASCEYLLQDIQAMFAR